MDTWLKPARVRIYCAVVLATNLSLLLVSVSRSTDHQIGGDYLEFYNAGFIFNHHPHGMLYDVDLQDSVYKAQGGLGASLPFAYAPFFVLPCAAVAHLPYALGFLTWTLASILLVWGSYELICRTVTISSEWRTAGLLAALAFPAFEFYTLRGGQTSAFGLSVLALAFYLNHKRRRVLAGLALSLLLYKPPLLLLLLPLLLITKQWRTILGFTFGAVSLIILSFLLVGTQGLIGYAEMLRLMGAAVDSSKGVFQTRKYVDIGAALRLLVGWTPRIVRLALLAGALPFLWRAWRKADSPATGWGLAVVATLFLSFYTPIYDTTLLIFVVLVVRPFRIGALLIVVVFVLSAVTVPIAAFTRLQLFTIALAWMVSRVYRVSLGSPITHLRTA